VTRRKWQGENWRTREAKGARPLALTPSTPSRLERVSDCPCELPPSSPTSANPFYQDLAGGGDDGGDDGDVSEMVIAGKAGEQARV